MENGVNWWDIFIPIGTFILGSLSTFFFRYIYFVRQYTRVQDGMFCFFIQNMGRPLTKGLAHIYGPDWEPVAGGAYDEPIATGQTVRMGFKSAAQLRNLLGDSGDALLYEFLTDDGKRRKKKIYLKDLEGK